MPEQRYDSGYKDLLANHDIFLQMVKSFLKEKWVDNIDETSITPVNKSFIMPDFTKKEADIVYHVKTKDAKTDIYLYLLLELQSGVDHMMPYRLLVYMMGVWGEHIKNNKEKTGRKDFRLPPVVPIILYNDSDRWTAAKSFKEMLTGYELFGKYVLDFEYFLIDVNRCEPKTLAEMGNVISSIFLVEQNREITSQVISILEKLSPTLEDFSQEHLRIFTIWLNQVVLKAIPKESKKEILEYLKETYPEKLEVKEVVSNVTKAIERSLETSRLEGIAEGKLEGKIEGKIEAAQSMLDRGMDEKLISEVLNLSLERIRELKGKKMN